MSQQQNSLMHYDPATGVGTPYPSHAAQWRTYHGKATAWLFNPWNGERRSAGDVGSDPIGLLIVPIGEPLCAEFDAGTGENLQPWQQRIIAEKDELDAKVKKLVAFLRSDAFTVINSAERERLQEQVMLMLAYSHTLGERIAAFSA